MNIDTQQRPWWKSSWPIGRRQWKQLAVAFVAVVGVGLLVGFLLSDWLAPNAITEADVEIAEWFERQRTETFDDLAFWGSFLSDTPVKIAASAVAVIAMLAAWRRWHEAVFVALTLIFEASAFGLTTIIVQRPRPDVEQLQESPVDSSFPSGHVAAATVYLAFAVVVFWRTRRTGPRIAATVVLAVVPLVVALARLYQGMHYLSDVIAGLILGLSTLWICLRVLGAPPDAETDILGEPTAPASEHVTA